MQTNLLEFTPAFEVGQIPAILSAHYDLACAECQVLDSERDQNFLVTISDGNRHVFKIANAAEDPDLIQAQSEMLEVVSRACPGICPQIVPNRHGNSLTALDQHERRYLARLVDFLPGTVLASLEYVSPQLQRQWGRMAGQIGQALREFDHPALHREFHWDLACAESVIDSGMDYLTDAELRQLVGTLLEQYRSQTRPLLDDVPCSVVHNDANDGNLIVNVPVSGDYPNTITGVIDFGDAVHSWTIADLAISIAYAWLKTDDPLETARNLIQGYLEFRPISETEAAALFGLACMRLCTSAVIAARQYQQRPDDPYLMISQAAVKTTLPKLAEIPFEFAAAATVQMAGHSPVRNYESVTAWLGQPKRKFAFPICRGQSTDPPTPDELTIFDLSVGSSLLTGDPANWTETRLTSILNQTLSAAGASIGVGRYLEPRLLYAAGQYGATSGWSRERRTVHLGMDLFAAAGTLVIAPLAGTVYTTATIERPLDYGGLLILHHAPEPDVEFFSLFGHLDPVSIRDLNPGQPVEPGQTIAQLGTPAVNGGWTPHLHFQVILNLLDLDHLFPGVCQASQQETWSRFSPDPNLILRIPNAGLPNKTAERGQQITARRQYTGPGLSLSYDQPVRPVRGQGQYLYDDAGRCLLDAYNNVPHVGHSHPDVVAAIQRQMTLLNTNTRYLHENLGELARRIAATLPDPLNICYFVNSASEANELALRLARTYTGARDLIVQEGAYHGNTTTLVDISPYKNQGPGGQGCPDWVHRIPLADTYRGEYRDPQTAGPLYAAAVRDVTEQLQVMDRKLCGLIVESCPSVAGQILFPPNYLSHVYRHVRAAGGLCIADEVQTGYGRLGDVFFGFQLQQVTPDIVVLGKPIGNGHPLAAVMTTREIADAFDNGMEFFSTFGGNTVSCAAGLAVLDVLEHEQLQDNARQIGQKLLAGFRNLQSGYPLIGDVRGSGFYLGIELVQDPESLEPATAAARFVSNRMRSLGVLIGVDGYSSNVLKIRPPMCFANRDAEILIDSLDRSFREWTAWR